MKFVLIIFAVIFFAEILAKKLARKDKKKVTHKKKGNKSRRDEVTFDDECDIIPAAEQICKKYGRRLTFLMFKDYKLNKINDPALAVHHLERQLDRYTYEELHKSLEAYIGPVGQKTIIPRLYEELNKLRNIQNRQYLDGMGGGMPDRIAKADNLANSYEVVFGDFSASEYGAGAVVGLLRDIAIEKIKDHMVLQASDLTKAFKGKPPRLDNAACRGSYNFSCE